MLHWIHSLLTLLFPRYCTVCDNILRGDEKRLCLKCDINLPRTYYHLQKENNLEKLFWGRIPIERATALFFYNRGSDYKAILHRLKYKNDPGIGSIIGEQMSMEIAASDFFAGIDVIIPVPLHSKKLRKRGYNQSEEIAKGVARATGIPLATTSVKREKNTETQTKKSTFERWENVSGIFVLSQPEQFVGKHILLVDDVLTTGATICAVADAFKEVEGVRFSVLTLAVAQQ